MRIYCLFEKIYREHYRRRFRNSYPDLRFHPGDSTFEYKRIDLGKRVFINRRAYFSAPAGEISVGEDVMFGADVFLSAGNHAYLDVGAVVRAQGYGEKKQRIQIDDDVWIASKVCVLGNVRIYEGAVIGAASLVLEDMPPYCLCVGSPCKPKKLRYSDAELREHYRLLGKDWNDAENMIQMRRSMLQKTKTEDIYLDDH